MKPSMPNSITCAWLAVSRDPVDMLIGVRSPLAPFPRHDSSSVGGDVHGYLGGLSLSLGTAAIPPGRRSRSAGPEGTVGSALSGGPASGDRERHEKKCRATALRPHGTRDDCLDCARAQEPPE